MNDTAEARARERARHLGAIAMTEAGMGEVVRFGDVREEMVFRRLQRALRLTDDQFVALVRVAVDQISPNRRKNAANPSPAEGQAMNTLPDGERAK